MRTEPSPATGRHLEPGGTLSFTCHTEEPGETTGFTWRLRRTGTAADTGITYVAHEATGDDDSTEQVQLWFSRLESYDRDGLLTGTWLRRIRLRWWTRDELRSALAGRGLLPTSSSSATSTTGSSRLEPRTDRRRSATGSSAATNG